MPGTQTLLGTETLEDVAVRLTPCDLDRTTGEWTPKSAAFELVVDSIKVSRPTTKVNVKPGQEGRQAFEVTDVGFEIALEFKSQFDDFTANGIRYAIEAAYGGYWRWWLVEIFAGGAWIPYPGLLTDSDWAISDAGQNSLKFGPARRA